ncbi:MAG TPA: PAS domain S-box protein, partial [Allocoleopsis sp.]
MATQRTVLVIASSEKGDTAYQQQLQQDRGMDYNILLGHGSNLLPVLSHSFPKLDGILLELESPYNQSFQLLRHLKEQTSAPVIVIDGGDTEVAVQAFKQGAVDYLVKDKATPDDLCLAMRSAIENAELKRELQRSQETFHTSVENMLDCFGIFSAMRDDSGQIVDFRIDYLNAAACENNQLPKAMQIGRGLCEILPAHRESGLFDEYCWVVNTGEPLIKDSLVYDDTYSDRNRRLVRAFDIRATKLNDGFVASWRDVTDRRQLELELSQTVAELRASQQHSRDLAEAMPQIVWTADASGAVNYWNQAWYEYTGLSEAEAFGLAGVSTVHPDERDRVLAEWSYAVSHRQSFEIEYRIQNREGEYRWFICRATPTCDREQQITGWIGTITDIDQQKQAALALQQSQERLELAMRAASMGSWDWNIQTGEVHWSTNLEHLFGMVPGSFAGRYETVRAMIHPEDLTRVEAAIQRALYNHEEYNLEFRFIKPDGTVRWAVGLGRVFYDDDGHPVMMTGVDMDISHRKQVEAALKASEANLRGMADNAPVMIWVTDPTGYCTYLNRSWYDFTGQAEATSLGFGWLDVVHPEDSESAKAIFLKANALHESFRLEYRLRHHSGTYHWAIDAAHPWFGEDGDFKGYIGAVIDISNRKQAEANLRQSEEFKNRLLESSPDCIKVLDIDGRLLYMNTGGMCIMEIDELTPYLNQDWVCFWGDEYRPLAEQALEAARAGETSIFRGFCPTAKGSPKWWEVIVSPIRGASGQTEQVLSVSRDISDRKQAELRLRESEERLQLGMQVAGFALVHIDYITNTVNLSPEAAVLYGLPAEQLIISREQFHATFHPEDRPQLEQR